MKNVEYDIPVFESRDVSDLNLYSERMAEAIKKQIDKFGNPLVFKGIKQTRSELDSITNAQNGDMYRVRENGKNYIWDGNEWVVYSDAIVIDDFQTKIIKVIQEVETPTPVTGTKINIKDSVEAKITEFNISGNHKQETREGYNIFNPDKAFIVNTRTVGGATINKNSDGSFSISGTGELTANFGGGYTDYTHEETIALLKEGAITFNCGAKTTPCCVIELIGQSTYFSLNNSASTSLSATITSEMLADTSLKLRASFYGKTGQTIVGGTIKPMLYQQGNGTFEQFGKSPSPNYSSEVKTVGDNINLYNYEIANEYTNGLSEQINNDGSFTATGTATTTWANLSKNNSLATELKKGEQYIIQHEETTKAINIMFSNDSAEQKVAIKGSKNVTFTANINITKARVYVEGLTSGSSYEITDRIHITKGTTPKPYSLYNQGSTEIIKCNKNIFKMKDKYFTTKGRNQYQCLYLKSYTTNSVTVWTQYGGTYQFAYIIIPNLKPNTSYSLRYDLTKNETTYSPNMSLQNGKKTDNNGNLEIMINLGNNANASIAGKNIVFDNIQIEEGATMTPYVNHQEEIYNMPIQQEMLEEDKFDWDNEKEVHNWKKLVINGTENWSMFPNTPKLGLFMLSIDDIKSNQEEYAIEDIICTHFKAKSLNNTWLGKEGISVGNKQIRIFCSSNDTNTVEKWKAYLVAQYNAGTPVIVYYKLEVPTQLAFTTQQKEVAKQIKQAKTYDGVTNIYSECEVEPNLEIIYKKNIQTLFDNTLI